MAEIRIKYFTKEKLDLINPENLKKYDKYLKSNIIKNKDVEKTTYLVYENYFKHFLVFLAEHYDNIDLYSEEYMENAVDIMEDYISFMQDTLKNNKKAINTKLSAVSTFYHWSVKRRYIQYHPFDKRLDRMKNAKEEHILNSYWLTDEQVEQIREGLKDKKYDMQDKVLFEVMLDSANRIGAISLLTLKDMDLDECLFKNIREKRGYHVEVVFSTTTRDLIEEWLNYRKENLDNLEIDGLFVCRYNKQWIRMGKSSLQRRINKIGLIIGLEDFHSHCMRKTSLNDIYEKTGNIELASAMGNHKNTQTTLDSYIKPKSKTQVRDKIRELIEEKEEIKHEKDEEKKEKPIQENTEEPTKE